jgi:hypothetical protein
VVSPRRIDNDRSPRSCVSFTWEGPGNAFSENVGNHVSGRAPKLIFTSPFQDDRKGNGLSHPCAEHDGAVLDLLQRQMWIDCLGVQPSGR